MAAYGIQCEQLLDSRILNQPSSADKRLNGDPDTFRRKVRCYWRVDARDYNNEEDYMNIDKMTDAEVLKLGQWLQEIMGK